MQKITCVTFNGYSLIIVSCYRILRKLFFEHYLIANLARAIDIIFVIIPPIQGNK